MADSDLDISNVPLDFSEYLMKGLENNKEPGVWKAGISFEIDDIPQTKYGNEVYRHESGFWKNDLFNGFYHVWIDIGLTLHDRSIQGQWWDAIRAYKPYTGRHLDWYLSKETVREEDMYFWRATKDYFGWGMKFYKEALTDADRDELFKKFNIKI